MIAVVSMQINLRHIISFKVSLYSACYLANDDYISYLLEKQSDRGEEVELFSVSIQVVEAAL